MHLICMVENFSRYLWDKITVMHFKQLQLLEVGAFPTERKGKTSWYDSMVGVGKNVFYYFFKIKLTEAGLLHVLQHVASKRKKKNSLIPLLFLGAKGVNDLQLYVNGRIAVCK